MKPNITQLVVEQDKCIGCGVCSAICPVDVLPMSFNHIGLFQPFEKEGCLDKCTLCIDVCPFVESNKSEKEVAQRLYQNEINVNHHDDLGYFVQTYEIYKKDTDDRLQSASGGAGHALLKALLESKKVDAILSVEPNDDPEKLFKFSVFSNSLELEKTRGSVYYPTELSEVLEYVMKKEGNYAITVLPCYATAIRLAQEKNHKLRKRIKYLVGLVCGQMKTKEFTHALAKNTLGTDRLKSVKYRVKQENEPASNYAFEFESIENGSVGRVSWTSQLDGPAKLWSSRMFTPIACNSCTDVFAYDADIVLMDAWLHEYTKDYKGHTLVIVRTNELNEFIQSIHSLSVEKIAYQKVFKSQKAVVANKNAVALGSKNPFVNAIAKKRVAIQMLSHKSYEANKKQIDNLLMDIKKIEKFYGLILLPTRIVFKLYRVFKGMKWF